MNLASEEFDITAKSIKLLQNNEKIIAEGNVLIVGENEITIESEKASYDKKENIIDAEKSVKITNTKTNDQITSDKIKYLRNSEQILIEGNVLIKGKNGITIETESVSYDKRKELVTSENLTTVKDKSGNSILLDMFNYSLIDEKLRSKGYIKITDKYKNKYFFDDVMIDVKENRMAGSNLKVKFNKSTFGNIENDPRLVANSAVITENKSYIEKGIFTTCKKRKDGKCPPWKIKAKKIIHDKEKQIIYYESARVDFYKLPILYFPKFYHPDPTVKRQSGLLVPSLTNSTLLGTGLQIPYFFALADHKDMTLSPKIYYNENPVIQSEYRHKTKNTYSIIDTSFNQGYKVTSKDKTGGSRNHIFAKSNIDLNFDTYNESNLEINLQSVSNDTYLRVHNINSPLITNETFMNSSIEMDLTKEDSSLSLSTNIYKDLSKTDERYEVILPNYDYKNKMFFSDKLGKIDFQSRGYYKKYQTNKSQAKFVNDFFWNSNDYIGKSGILTKFEGNLKNANYKAEKTSDHKSEDNNYEIAGALSLTSSLPLEKIDNNSKKNLTPKFMLRFAPGHMRDMNNAQLRLGLSNLYSLNKLSGIDNIEKGTSLTLGTDYSHKNKKNNFDTINLSLGQVFNLEKNDDMPKQSSLNQKTSELIGDFGLNINEFNRINYKFSLANNYNSLNYNEFSGIFKVNNIVTNFEYIEENNHIGNNHLINAGLALEIDKSNSLNFKTRKNFVTDSTEFYNLSYQYENDCLTAAIEYNRAFYTDRDLKPSNNLMFTITFIPFGKISTPVARGN